MGAIQQLKKFLQLSPDLTIHPQVRANFRRNFIANTMDGSFWMLGESFVSVNTILPVFASTLTDSAILIGLVPALINAGWLIPQLLLASYVKHLPQKLPFTKSMALVERMPYLVLPLTAFLLHWIPRETVLWIFLIVVAWRGFAGGMVALPWQELIASIIPSTARSRFIGVSRTLGRFMAVLGSAAAGLILAGRSYPDNYAFSFLIGAAFIWFSYLFFCRTIEPDRQASRIPTVKISTKKPLIDFSLFKELIKRDGNFRNYLTSRAFFQLGSMATGFFAIYGIQRFSLADEQAAIFSGLLFSSGILGFLIWGVFGDRVGPKIVLLVSDMLQVFVLVLAFFVSGIWAYYLLFLIFGFAQSGYIIGELILGMELGDEEERPIYLGLARSIPGVFVLIAPLIGGLIVTWFGYRVMFLVAIAFSFVGMLLLLKVKERIRL